MHPTTSFAGRERECPDCGLFQIVPPLPRNGQASCVRCNSTLRRSRPNAANRTLALSLTSLVIYMVAVLAPFLSVDIVGKTRTTTMIDLPVALSEDGAWELGIIVMFTAIIAPLAKIMVLLWVLIGLRTESPPHSLPLVFKWYRRIGPWAMVEVFLLGVFVAFTRLGSIATVQTGIALYAVGGLMVTMVLADYLIDPEAVWEKMEAHGLVPPPGPRTNATRMSCLVCERVEYAREGARCSQCGSVLHVRLPGSLSNTWAFLIAAGLLYIPANIFPVLTVTRLGSGVPSTIIGGAQELLEAGMWPLALLVFVASILVPLLKLASLTFMLVETHRHSSWRLQDRTRLFRLVDFIGRWSMIDVFMLGTLVGLVRAGVIATIEPGVGAICFGSVVVLTMIAAACFDPRLMWDAASTAPANLEPSTAPANPRAV